MSVLVLGLNYKTAPVGLLERVAVPPERLGKALDSLTGRDHVAEAVVLSTCNRVEVYASVTRYHGGMADLRNFFAEWGGVAPEDFAGLAYDYFGDAAAAHLCSVAAGLDSMVVGERQIQLQVKEAFRAADAYGSCGRLLHALFRQALRAGKRARAETGISQGASSMVDVGLRAAEAVLGDLAGATALVVGAGKMGGMAATRLAGRGGRVLVTNRTADKADHLAARTGGEVLPIEALVDGLRDADLVLASTGSSAPLVGADTAATAMADRPERPLALVDLAVPRDVDPACGSVPGVTVLDIDAIRGLADTGATSLAGEVAAARAIVEEESGRFSSWMEQARAEPTIAALRARAESIRRAEVERLGGRLGASDERQRAAIDALTRGIVNTLLHEPSVRLKALAERPGGEQYAAAVRELFDLDE